MLTLLIIPAITIGIILYIKFLSYIDNERYKTKFKVVFDAHKKIGYPPLTANQQFEILDHENRSSVLEKTKHKIVPDGLLNHYLTIHPHEYLEHLKQLNLKGKMKFDSASLRDGWFIDIQNDRCYYIFVDRNMIAFRKKFKTYEQLLIYIVYRRLSIYAPGKYKFARYTV